MQICACVCLKMNVHTLPLLVQAFSTCLYPTDLVPIVTTGVCLCCVESSVRGEKSIGYQQLSGPGETSKQCG